MARQRLTRRRTSGVGICPLQFSTASSSPLFFSPPFLRWYAVFPVRSCRSRAWAGSVAAAYYLYPVLLPYARNYTDDDKIAIAGSAGVVFLVSLIVISFITSRIADFIIDSRIGALDRTLGFLFGAARGILLLVVAVAFWNWLVDVKTQPEWVTQAKSKPFLDGLVGKLEAVLPDDIEPQIRARILGKPQEPTTTQTPAEDVPATNPPATNN